jgi:NAD(P)-dependent dehydrogenase (short-subunit alcohol dehydrogenase family)
VADLTGRTILVTGARVKIGYQCIMKLLRCGATVIATTRFPADCAKRVALEKDFANFKDRIHIYGVDFRHIPGVEAFASFICSKYTSLEGIVNNACQTVRRPMQYYQHLMGAEKDARAGLEGIGRELLALETARADAATAAAVSMASATNDGGAAGSVGVAAAARTGRGSGASTAAVASMGGDTTASASFEMSQVPTMVDDLPSAEDAVNFPANAVDVNGQQIDLRKKTSWVLELSEVQTPEVCEVLSVNTIAPLVLNSTVRGFSIEMYTRECR